MTPDDDLGLFGPGSVTWRLHEEPILMLAGLRSLYLQSLHPRAVAGVVQNSSYRDDPYGRLARTSMFVGITVYGTTAQVQAAARRIRRLHAKLRGVDPHTGETFRVDHPDLLRWVHIAEVESFLSTARRAGLRLTPDEVDRYYTEQRRSAALMGLEPDSVPGTAAEVEDYYAGIRPQLRMTREAAETAVFLSAPPLPYGLGFTPVRLAYGAVAATAFGLLPPWARRMYGLPGLPTTDLSAVLSARTMRLALGLLPRSVYDGPLRRAALARAARQAAAAA